MIALADTPSSAAANDGRNLLTTSAQRAYRACPRRFFLAYEQGYRPLTASDPLAFGTLGHRGLEAWWLAARDYPATPDTWWEAGLSALEVERDDYQRARAQALMWGYHCRWHDMTWQGEPIYVLAVEAEFAGPLLNPETGAPSKTWQRAGKLDVLVSVAGRTYVVEHKCLPASATVFDHSTGRYVYVRELYEERRGASVTAMTDAGVFVVAQAKAPVPAGVRSIFCVKTLGGRALRASGNHPVWTHRGWIAAGELRAGDWVATPKHMSSSVPDAPISDEEIRLIGYMIGDGALSRMMFSKSDERVLVDVVACAARVGEVVCVTRPENGDVPYISFSQAKQGRYAQAKGAGQGSVSSKESGYVGPVYSLMVRARLAGRGSADKRAPFHLALSDRQLGQLVGALWSTDGCVDTHGTKLRIIYTSVSDGLCQDIQAALQRLGIVSNVRRTTVGYNGQRRSVSTVQVVSRESKRRFLALIREGVIPVIRTAVPLDVAAKCISTAKQGDDNRMQPQLDPAIWWDRVESVTEEAAEEVYDIEVPGPHTFVVDGIVTHNTTSEDIAAGGDYWQRLLMDPQVSNYVTGARLLGHGDVAGVIYDVIKKTSLRPLQATPEEKRKYTKPTKADTVSRLYAGQRAADETPDEYYARLIADLMGDDGEALASHYARALVVRLEAEEREAAADLWATGTQIRDARRLKLWPRNPDACVRYGSKCPYWDACAGIASLEDGSRFRRVDNVHEELVMGRRPAEPVAAE